MQGSKGNVAIGDLSGIVPFLDMVRIQSVIMTNHELTAIAACAAMLIEAMESNDPVGITIGFNAVKAALALYEMDS